MKKVFKWIFIVIIVVIFAIDIAGFWKYKLKGTNKKSTETTAEETTDIGIEPVEETPKIEYSELSSTDFKNGEKLFITNIDTTDNSKYTVQGCIYEEYEITKTEYDNVKAGKSTVKIFDIEYSKDQIKSNNLILKSLDENAESLYIKYDSKTKKYIVMDSSTDYKVYKSTEKYVKTDADGKLVFSIEKSGKTTKTSISNVADSYKNIELPKNTISFNLSELTFNKSGVCTKIQELDV